MVAVWKGRPIPLREGQGFIDEPGRVEGQARHLREEAGVTRTRCLDELVALADVEAQPLRSTFAAAGRMSNDA